MTLRYRHLAAVCLFCALSLPFRALTLAAVPTVTTCDAANPFDDLPDHVALQSCVDNFDFYNNGRQPEEANNIAGLWADGLTVSTGAVVNLAVDGLNGGSVWNNSMSGAQGNRVPNCPGKSADYTVAHVINVGPLQSGYVVRIFDVGSNCQ